MACLLLGPVPNEARTEWARIPAHPSKAYIFGPRKPTLNTAHLIFFRFIPPFRSTLLAIKTPPPPPPHKTPLSLLRPRRVAVAIAPPPPPCVAKVISASLALSHPPPPLSPTFYPLARMQSMRQQRRPCSGAARGGDRRPHFCWVSRGWGLTWVSSWEVYGLLV